MDNKSFQYSGQYLTQFAERDRSQVTSYFCYSFREWVEWKPSPEELLRATCARVLRSYREGDPKTALLEQMYHTFSSDEALKFSAFIVWRESLSPEERARLRERGYEFYRRRFLAELPVSDAQLRYLRKLGCDQVPANRLEASDLINELGPNGERAA